MNHKDYKAIYERTIKDIIQPMEMKLTQEILIFLKENPESYNNGSLKKMIILLPVFKKWLRYFYVNCLNNKSIFNKKERYMLGYEYIKNFIKISQNQNTLTLEEIPLNELDNHLKEMEQNYYLFFNSLTQSDFRLEYLFSLKEKSHQIIKEFLQCFSDEFQKMQETYRSCLRYRVKIKNLFETYYNYF